MKQKIEELEKQVQELTEKLSIMNTRLIAEEIALNKHYFMLTGEKNIQVINDSGYELPAYQTAMSAGLDLHSKKGNGVLTIAPHSVCVVNTGLRIALPEGFEAQIRSRSGLAAKYQIFVLNSPATIDADFRGEMKVILYNMSDIDFIVYEGDRIAQMVINRYEKANLIEVKELDETARGEGGLGHTGK